MHLVLAPRPVIPRRVQSNIYGIPFHLVSPPSPLAFTVVWQDCSFDPHVLGSMAWLPLLLIYGPSATGIGPWMLGHAMMAILPVQALGPVALVSLLLNDGLTKAIPGSDINENPNLPEDPELQAQFNRAAVQVHSAASSLRFQPWHHCVGCRFCRDPSRV